MYLIKGKLNKNATHARSKESDTQRRRREQEESLTGK